MQARFEPKDVLVQYDQIDFAYSESVLIEERKNAREYISNALKTIE